MKVREQERLELEALCRWVQQGTGHSQPAAEEFVYLCRTLCRLNLQHILISMSSYYSSLVKLYLAVQLAFRDK